MAKPSAARGILGSTIGVVIDLQADTSDNTFYDEGHEADYAVSGLFNGLPIQRAMVSRRRLVEQAVAEEFAPMYARLSA